MAKIDKLYAFIMEEGDGPETEGIMAVRMESPEGDPFWMPLVGGDMSRVQNLTEFADSIAKTKNKPYKIVEFHKVSETRRQPEAKVRGGKLLQ